MKVLILSDKIKDSLEFEWETDTTKYYTYRKGKLRWIITYCKLWERFVTNY